MGKRTGYSQAEIDDWNREIDDLLAATQKPFDNRLEAAIYLWFAEEMDQTSARSEAKSLGWFLRNLVHMDVDRQA